MTDAPPRRRRWPLRLALFLFGLPVLAILLLWAAINTAPVRDALLDMVLRAINGPDLTVTVGELSGPLPQAPALRDITVADGSGTWLTIDFLSLAWSPLDLLSGRLSVERLGAGRIDVSRPPGGAAEPEPPASEPAGLPVLPVAVRLDELRIGTMVLGAPVLGQAASYTIRGQAALPIGGTIESRLEVAGVGGTGGNVSLRAAVDTESRALDLDLTVSEPANGLVASLAGLPGRPAMEASLTGAGPANDWRGQLSVTADDILGVTADVTLDAAAALGADDPYRAAIDAAIRHGFDLGAEVERLVGADIGLSASVAMDPDSLLLDARRLTVTGRSFTVDASGRVALDTLELDTAVAVRLTDTSVAGDLVPGLQIGALSMRADVSGPATRPAAAIEISAADVAVDGMTVRSALLDGIVEPDRPFGDPAARLFTDVTITLSGISGLPPEAQTVAGEDATLGVSGSIGLADLSLRVASLSARAGIVDVTASGAVALGGGPGDMDATVRLTDLAALSAIAGADLAGRAWVSARLQGDILGGAISGRVTGAAEELRLGMPDVEDLVGPAVRLEAEIGGGADSVWTVRGLTVEAGGVSLSGNANIDPGAAAFGAGFGMRLADLSRLSAVAGTDLAGILDVTGTLSGPFDAPRLSAHAELYQGRTAGIAWQRLSADADLARLTGVPRGSLSLSADGDYGPLDLSANLDGDAAGGLRVDDIRATGVGVAVAGGLSLPASAGAVVGELRAEIESLAPGAALAGVEAEGGGTLTLALSARDGQQHLDGALSLRDVAMSEAGADTLRLASLDARLTGRPTDAQFSIGLAGDRPMPLELDLSGSVRQDESLLTVVLDGLSATIAGQALALRRQAVIEYGDALVRVRGLDLDAASGRLTAELSLDETAVSADVKATGMPADLVRLAAPEVNLAGRWDAAIRLSGPPSAPDGTFSVTVAEAALADDPTLQRMPPLGASVTGSLEDGRLRLEGGLEGLPEIRVALTAEAPLQLSVQPPAAGLPDGGAISARLIVDGEIGRVWEILPVGAHRLTGRLAADISVDGPLDDLQPEGTLTLEGGRYENLDSGTLLTGAALEVTGDRNQVTLVRATAADAQGGSLTASGGVDLSGADPVLQSSLTMNTLQLVNRDEVMATASGEIALAGPVNGLRLSGRIVTDLIEIRLVDNLPPQVVTLDVTEVGGPDDGPPPPPEAEADDAAAPVALDMTVEIPRRMFVRGLGLDSEWAGNLQIGGNADEPQVTGTISPVRGQFSLAGAVFQLQEGGIGFSGGASVVPDLNLAAAHDAGDVQAIIRVTGPATEPELALSSVPEMPQEEILSRVLFDTSSQELTASQAIQLADAAASLSGLGGSSGGLVERVRQSLGVDVLRLGSNEEGSTVTAGRYIGDNIFVGARQGAAPGSTEATVEVEVLPNLSVETDVGQNARQRVGVKWKWDY